jgi:hypothetical protein
MKAALPSCPRCGYDLSGQADAARREHAGQLPLMGQCSECGLEMEWADAYEPNRTRVRGFIEHVDRWFLFAAWRTWWMAVLPWVFWRRVKIEMAVRPGRVVVWFFLTLGLLWALAAGACDAVDLVMYPGKGGSLGEMFLRHWLLGSDVLPGTPFIPKDDLIGVVREIPAGIGGPLACAAVVPVVLLCLPDTRRLAKLRPVLVFRAFVYSLVWFVPVLFCRVFIKVGFETFTLAYWSMRLTWTRPSSTESMFRDMNYAVHDHPLLLNTLFLAWLAVWWWCALRLGWRIQEYRRVWWAIIIPGWLAAGIASALSYDGYRIFL